MATLVLTAVGTAVGGPVGGAIGSIVGQYIDQNVLFAPKARHGPRLGDLSVQTSAYGSPIPKIFGRMRVAGTVVWATDLIETRSTSGGGKGRPKTVAYSYSASFAVALSARPIRSVGRIWAEGKLLRGAGGDFKAATGFRLHLGDEDQPADPLIASAEGAGETPAYRGLAYAVFENLQLEDFGNRIPSLTFEIEADPGPVALGAIAAELGEGEVATAETPMLAGYAAGGDSIRSAIEALGDVVPLSLSDRDGKLRLAVAADPPAELSSEEECARRQIVRQPAGSVADEVSIAYYDPDRDFQAGLQRATGGGAPAPRSADRRALPAVLSAEAAKALAEFRLAALRAARTGARLRLGWRRAALRPGDAVRLAGESGLWRIRRWTLEPMRVALELVRLSNAPVPDVLAEAGRPVREPDLRHGPTVLRLFELLLAELSGDSARLFAAAAGPEAGWRRAALSASFDGGTTWDEAGATSLPAVIGSATTMLPPAGSTLIDVASAVEVELLNESMWLGNASDDALVNGANLALLGSELIQFGAAEWLGGTRFRLSRLLRGRRGTEWAAGQHEADEDFTLIERDALAMVDAPANAVGAAVSVSAIGVDDSEAATANLIVTGESLRPPSPVHLRAERLGGGDIAIGWARRSRRGWDWPSGAETPLTEEAEAYRLVIAGAGFERVVATTEAGYLYTAAEQAQDEAAGAMTLSVVQLGTYGASRAASATLD